MSIFTLLRKELFHRKGNAVSALAVVTTIVGLIVTALLLGDAYERQTASHVTKLDDEIRKTMKELGFNVFILPRDLNLTDFFKQDFGDETMDEQLVHKLANAKGVVTVNHLRPALIQKVDWPEQSRPIILMGVKGVVPWSHRKNPKKPLSQPVAPGMINLGHLLARDVDAEKGSIVQLKGREFTVGSVYPPRGNQDDITAWIDLQAVQEIASKPQQINMIQALNCNCASVDALAEIEAEITGVLGEDVKVIERNSELVARAQARTKVAASGAEKVDMLRRATRTGLGMLTVMGSIILALVFLRNANQRMNEVGMLRAIGVSRNQILGLFLGKAGLFGVLGGCSGLILGVIAAKVIAGASSGFESVAFDSQLMFLAPAAAGVISMLATWIPVEAVTGRDPALILRQAS